MAKYLPRSSRADAIARVFFPSKAHLVNYCSTATLPAGQPQNFVLYLEREGVRSLLNFSGLPDELDPLILYHDTSISV